MKNVVEVRGLSKNFKLPHERYTSLKQTVLNWNKRSYESFHVLQDINFEVKEGEFFGIVGRNGSGKSTLLKLLAGIYAPTTGSIKINGRLTPFIELGVGFNMELTGRDNVFLNGILLGLSKDEVSSKYAEIVEFAELEKFMDQKLKNYSSGMQVRLAFSIAIQAHADVLLVDEVLAVGDTNFQRKCFEVFKNIKKQGKTVIFVSHDMGAVQEYCDRAILIDSGKIVFAGKSRAAAKQYEYLNLAASEKELNKRNIKDAQVMRWGNRSIEIIKTETLLAGSPKNTFSPDDKIEIQVTCEAKADIPAPVYGVTVKNLDGLAVFATNTKAQDIETADLKAGDRVTFTVTLDNAFNDGTYLIAPAVASTDTRTSYDWIEEAFRFQVGGWPLPFGVVQPRHKFAIKKGSR